MVFQLLLLLAGRQQTSPPLCAFPVAADAIAARRIAEAGIANVGAPLRAPGTRGARYILHVEPDQNDAAKQWEAFLALPPARQLRDSSLIRVTAGGGGLRFRIDRCTGEVSRLPGLR